MERRDPFRRMVERMDEAFRSFQDLQRDIDFGGASFPVDVEEEKGHLVVRADLPGIEKKMIDVKASEDSVEIGARDEREVEREEKSYFRRERSSRKYYRNIELPASVDPDTAEASYENGVLTVRIELAEESGKKDVDVS